MGELSGEKFDVLGCAPTPLGFGTGRGEGCGAVEATATFVLSALMIGHTGVGCGTGCDGCEGGEERRRLCTGKGDAAAGAAVFSAECCRGTFRGGRTN